MTLVEQTTVLLDAAGEGCFDIPFPLRLLVSAGVDFAGAGEACSVHLCLGPCSVISENLNSLLDKPGTAVR